MAKKLVYRFVDGVPDATAPVVFAETDAGSTSEMDLRQARNGLPETVRKDDLIYDRQSNAFYVGGVNGEPRRVTDIVTLARYSDRPLAGIKNRLYIILHDNILCLWDEEGWHNLALSDVTIAQYYGVSTHDTKDDLPKRGEDRHLYLTKDGYGFRYDPDAEEYVMLFGDNTWGYTKDESDARFAFKSDIVRQKTLDELGGITPQDVDRKIADFGDKVKDTYATLRDNDSKADADTVYSKYDADQRFALRKDIPTLSSLGALSTEFAEATFARQKKVDEMDTRLRAVTEKANTLSEYSKTAEMQEAIDKSIADAAPDFSPYATLSYVDKRLLEKANKAAAITRDDLKAYALVSQLPTIGSLGGLSAETIEQSFAKKEDVDAADKKIRDTHYTKDEIDKRFIAIGNNTYTREEVDLQLSEYEAPGGWATYARKAEVDKTYAKAADVAASAKRLEEAISTKADAATAYTKDEIDYKIGLIQSHGVDLSGCMMKGDAYTEKFVDRRAQALIDNARSDMEKTLPDASTYITKENLLAAMIEQDKASSDNLMLNYFVSQDDLAAFRKNFSRYTSEKGRLVTDVSGVQSVRMSKGVLVRSELMSGHNPIHLYVNGVHYTEGDEFTYDSANKQLLWGIPAAKGGFDLDETDDIRVEYEQEAE